MDNEEIKTELIKNTKDITQIKDDLGKIKGKIDDLYEVWYENGKVEDINQNRRTIDKLEKENGYFDKLDEVYNFKTGLSKTFWVTLPLIISGIGFLIWQSFG